MKKYVDEFNQILIHTGQHYDKNMSKIFFDELELPEPDINMGIGSGSHAKQTAQIMMNFEKILLDKQPDWVIVGGDVNSTIACALTAAKMRIKVAHIEAGLRSFDRTMPEEINRILTDHISCLLFTTEPSANNNLRREGIPKDDIYFVGNVMIDTLMRLIPKADNSRILEKYDVKHNEYALVTLHRPSNVDDYSNFEEIIAALCELKKHIPVIFPIHPRTRLQMNKIAFIKDNNSENDGLILIEPLGYIDFLALMKNAAIVITDSGGIQEETTFLNIECVTIRENTERPITITKGTNRLVSINRNEIVRICLDIIGREKTISKTKPPIMMWDGKSAERIVRAIRVFR